MLSEHIVKNKPHIVAPATSPINLINRKGFNRSGINSNADLETFLRTTPAEGTWCWRKSLGNWGVDMVLYEADQLHYVIRTLKSLAHLEMRFDRGTGWPMTHELITSVPYATGDHYRRFVDIRDYEQITQEQYDRFVSAELQNHIQTIITAGTHGS